MFRLFLVVPLTDKLWLQGMTMLSKKNLIESLVVKYPYHRGDWKFQKDGIGQNPVFFKNHYLLNFWNLYSLAFSLYGVIVKLHWQ